MSKRALAHQEREAQLERFTRVLRSSMLLLASLLLLGTVGLVAADQLYRPDAFAIKQLKVKGAFVQLNPRQVEAVITEHLQGNFFSVELTQIEQRVEALPWVQNAEIRREWPDTLMVEITEHQPIARWGDSAWVNRQGEVVELPGEIKVQDPIVFVGHQRDAGVMLQQSADWYARLAAYGLQIRELRLSESHAFTLQLRILQDATEFELLLGRSEVERRLQRFLDLYANQLLQKPQRLQRVDARYPDGLAVAAIPKPSVDPAADAASASEQS